MVVIIDAFILGIFASDLVDDVKKCQLDAGLMHREGKAAVAIEDKTLKQRKSLLETVRLRDMTA